MRFQDADVAKAALSPRWSALTALGAVADDLHNYDAFLLRDPRLLVPIDVQAFVVRAGVNDDPIVELPFRSDSSAPALDVLADGPKPDAGVHLLWSVPAALGRGTVVDDPQAPGDATRRQLTLPSLPDRWVVLRIAVLAGASAPSVTGWVVEADAAAVTPLADWTGTPSGTGDPAALVPPDRLDLHVGGPSWAQCWQSAQNRFALLDPLTDLAGAQLEGDSISYLVAGWWSDSSRDPLDAVGTDTAYRQKLADLGWNDPDHPSPDEAKRSDQLARYHADAVFGLPAGARFQQRVLEQTEAKGAATVASSGYVARGAMELNPALSGFVSAAKTAAQLPPAPTRSTLLTGRLHGVPLAADLLPDARPAEEALRVALGASTPDVAAVLSVQGTGLGAADEDSRRDAERLLAGFAANALMSLGNADVWSDIEDWEHAHSFGSLPGGIEVVERFVDRPGSAADPGAGFRPGGGSAPSAKAVPKGVASAGVADVSVLWHPVQRPGFALQDSVLANRINPAAQFDGAPRAVPPDLPATVREVARPAPAYRYPSASVLAVAGGGRALSVVEREEAAGLLTCRLADQVSRGTAGVLPADALLDTIGSAAVPDEVLQLARETLAEDPHLSAWRARLAAGRGADADASALRLHAEAALSFAYYAADNDVLSRVVGASIESTAARQAATESLLRSSLSDAVWAHPEGVTLWGQPWRPMFCDWQVRLDLDALAEWQLAGVDLDPAGPLSSERSITFTGRSPLVTGVAASLSAAIDTWLEQERQRDLAGHGLADPATEQSLAALRDQLARLDLLSVAFDGIREQLLGLGYDRGLVHDTAADGTRQAQVVAAAQLLAAGRLTVVSARLVDAFGRTLALPVDAALVAARLTESDTDNPDDPDPDPHSLLLRPRLTAPSRWRFDLVDANATGTDAAQSRVDQADRTKQVSPVAGFLLPDHLDESLEVFAGDGAPLGEVLHDPFSDAVSWEIAPGRTDVAPAAGPTDDPDATHHRVGWVAAGIVAADAAVRQATPGRPELESSLSALLRAIDTTLWTVDPFGALGTAHIAGLVGRPIAVVAARLALDIPSDANQYSYADGMTPEQRQAVFDELGRLEFEIRLGDLTRADDGLLGYFVDDDYTAFHVVDRLVTTQALPNPRDGGALGVGDPLAAPGADPTAPVPITHPYIEPAGVLRIRPGQTVRLTLLMHPGGRVYLTSGVLPRVSRALERDFVDPGLSVLAPSLRTGPLLIDADKVRLPKVASFPAEQLFTRRDTPTTWKDDPILAATQSALLPDQQPVVQEGWVRVAPNPPASGTASP